VVTKILTKKLFSTKLQEHLMRGFKSKYERRQALQNWLYRYLIQFLIFEKIINYDKKGPLMFQKCKTKYMEA